jgi:hypothetical protein
MSAPRSRPPLPGPLPGEADSRHGPGRPHDAAERARQRALHEQVKAERSRYGTDSGYDLAGRRPAGTGMHQGFAGRGQHRK